MMLAAWWIYLPAREVFHYSILIGQNMLFFSGIGVLALFFKYQDGLKEMGNSVRKRFEDVISSCKP